MIHIMLSESDCQLELFLRPNGQREIKLEQRYVNLGICLIPYSRNEEEFMGSYSPARICRWPRH